MKTRVRSYTCVYIKHVRYNPDRIMGETIVKGNQLRDRLHLNVM